MAQQKFSILGANTTADAWTGAAETLAQYASANMPQTPNGSSVLAWQNTGTQNSDGTLTITSGGNPPQQLDAPALVNQPSILVNNWEANNLTATNTSANSATPIEVELFGPGIAGFTPVTLVTGTQLALSPGSVATGQASPNYMQLSITSNTANLSILALVGGPVDATGNNAYVFALNCAGGAGTANYTKVTGGNTITYQFNWGSSSLFLANMSPDTAAAVNVLLTSL